MHFSKNTQNVFLVSIFFRNIALEIIVNGVMILYRALFRDFKDWMSLDANEQIVYSAIVNYAVMDSQIWDAGKRNLIMEVLYEMAENDGTIKLSVSYLTLDKLAKYCELSINTLKGKSGVFARLMKKGLVWETVYEYEVIVPVALLQGGWFELMRGTGLKAKQLIFFSFLCERLQHYNKNQYHKKGRNTQCLKNQTIDTWVYRLAGDFGETKTAVYSLIRELTKKGYLRRDANGKLEIATNGRFVRKSKAPKSTAVKPSDWDDDDLFALPF